MTADRVETGLSQDNDEGNDPSTEFFVPAPYTLDLLLEGARVGHELSAKYCTPDDADGGGCAAYHSFWQYWRILDIVRTTEWQQGTIIEALRPLWKRTSGLRIAVTGTADFSFAAQLVNAAAEDAASIKVVSIDRCQTPLALCDWYAERTSTPKVDTLQADLFDESISGVADIAVTTGIIGFFAPDERPRLFEAWHRLVRPGGKLIFTNVLRRQSTATLKMEPNDRIESFFGLVRKAAIERAAVLAYSPDEMEAMARTYISLFKSYPVESVEEIETLLNGAGFKVDHLQRRELAPGTYGALSVNREASVNLYAVVSATRE